MSKVRLLSCSHKSVDICSYNYTDNKTNYILVVKHNQVLSNRPNFNSFCYDFITHIVSLSVLTLFSIWWIFFLFRQRYKKGDILTYLLLRHRALQLYLLLFLFNFVRSQLAYKRRSTLAEKKSTQLRPPSPSRDESHRVACFKSLSRIMQRQRHRAKRPRKKKNDFFFFLRRHRRLLLWCGRRNKNKT